MRTPPRHWCRWKLGRLLTPLFGLPGNLNLIAVGVLYCVLAAIAIASLVTGLRIGWWAQLLVAAACWLAIADSAFFDVFGGPFSEPAALVGLMLVAAGVLYLGRGWRATVSGLVLAGTGGFLAILSKEQYLVLAAPVCITLVLATASRGSGRGLQRFRSRQAAAGLMVAAALAVLAAGYWAWDYTSSYGQRLHHIQAVDMIFTDIVTNRSSAPAQLRALGLPASWAKYAGDYYWDTRSVRFSPLYNRYEGKLTDGNIAHYLLTHPGTAVSVGQQSAEFAQQFRITTLGDYPVSAGHPKGAYESRVTVFTWLARQLPPRPRLVALPAAVDRHGRPRGPRPDRGAAPALAPGRRGPGALHDRLRRGGLRPAGLLRGHLHHPAHGGDEPVHRARLDRERPAGHLPAPAGGVPAPPAAGGRGRRSAEAAPQPVSTGPLR